MTEKDFEIISILYQTGNLTRAADQMYMTQSALTKKMQSIERELGVELLIRSRQGVRFTPAGETVMKYCRQVTELMEAMRKTLNEQQDTVCGTIHLGVSINYSTYRLPDVLADYHQQYPAVQLRLTTDQSRNLYRKMLDNELDVAILRGDYEWDGLRWMLSQERMCVICAKQYEYTPLTDYPFIERKSDPFMLSQIARWLRENQISSHGNRLQVDSLNTCMELAERGLGWALVPEICLDGFSGSVRRCAFDDGVPFVRNTWLLAQKDSMRLRQVDTFTALVKRAHNIKEGGAGI